MSSIESQKNDYPYMYGYMEPVEVKELATCPLTHYEHGLYAAAHCLVSERVGKFDLVDMVYAILKREYAEKRHIYEDEMPVFAKKDGRL